MPPAASPPGPAVLRALVWEARGRMRHTVEPLPSRLRAQERLGDRYGALRGVHFPDSDEEATQARGRLAFEANTDAIDRSRVKVSSKVLKLARAVQGDA